MGTPNTETVRKVVVGERGEFTLEEKVALLEARRDQVVGIMRYLELEDLGKLKLPHPLRMRESFDLSDEKITIPAALAGGRGLYYLLFRGAGSLTEGSVYRLIGLTLTGHWVRLKIRVKASYQSDSKPIVGPVEIEVPSTAEVVCGWDFEYFWIYLSYTVDSWVQKRQRLLQKALKVQVELHKQDAMVAPYFNVVGNGTFEEFAAQRG